ncbi:hypothetical protein TB2_011749 [Malus domestica]
MSMVENKVVSHFDSLNLEAGKCTGVVYGDLGTSPLFVLNSTFAQGSGPHEDVVGILSLIFYTLTLIPLIKYALIVLWANDNGGTFALYSLLCRHAKVSLIPNNQPEERGYQTTNLERHPTG